ncbi:MAG: CHASE domain-containing protein [Pseudomonadota bacterium]|nr:CHASE domain-containing protein [Pseudomonadota bacterium]
MNKNILRNVLVLLLYWGLALSTELLAIPPDYATPVWPAAGVALGFVLLYGRMIYPGIFLGALAANVYTSFNQGIDITQQQVSFAAIIGIGAVIQAAFARFLMARFSLLPEDLSNGSQILRFLVVAGPVSCLVNSLNGATMLGLFDIVPWSYWLSNWIVWWVGDSVGALVVTPFLIQLFNRNPQQERNLQTALLPISFLVLVIASFYFVRSLEQENRRTLIADIGQQHEAVLRLNINELKVILAAAASFFTASDAVTASDFDTFCRPLMQDHPSVLAVQWLPLIEQSERGPFVQALRQQGYHRFEIREIGTEGQMLVSRDHPRYLPIAYTHPFTGNERVHGLNVLGLEHRRGDLEQVLDQGKTLASEPLTLVQHQKSEISYIMAAPSYEYTGTRVNGVVQVIFKVDQVILRSIRDPAFLAAIRLLDVSDGGPPVTLYEGEQAGQKAEWYTVFEFLGRSIRLELSATTAIMQKVSSWQSYAILIGGLLYVALLEAVLLTMLTHQRYIQTQVGLKTQELALAKDVAEKASMAKTEFLASMSHELRTPLNSVIGFTHRVLRRSGHKLDERSRESLVIVERNANHLLGVINNLLDISKVDLGKLELSVSEFPLDEMLMNARDQFLPLALAKENTLRLDCQFHGMIQADSTRVRQIVINLLSNAVKFTAGGNITVSLVDHARNGIAGVLLKVEDEGIGISEKDIGRLFNKFEKVGNMERFNPEGTGLGLALVKELAELHGGAVSVCSEFGKGTTFSVWVPQRQVGVAAES